MVWMSFDFARLATFYLLFWYMSLKLIVMVYCSFLSITKMEILAILVKDQVAMIVSVMQRKTNQMGKNKAHSDDQLGI